MSPRAAVFLDRDGVLNELSPDPISGEPESPLHLADVRLIPGAAQAVVSLHAAGYLLVCVSNQPAAAKGAVSLGELQATHERVLELLASAGAQIDASYVCWHHPDGSVPALATACDCRKPAPGLLLKAARDLDLDLPASWIVGDSDSDVAAGRAAGCRTMLLTWSASSHRRAGEVRPDLSAGDLAEAAALLLDHPAR